MFSLVIQMRVPDKPAPSETLPARNPLKNRSFMRNSTWLKEKMVFLFIRSQFKLTLPRLCRYKVNALNL